MLQLSSVWHACVQPDHFLPLSKFPLFELLPPYPLPRVAPSPLHLPRSSVVLAAHTGVVRIVQIQTNFPLQDKCKGEIVKYCPAHASFGPMLAGGDKGGRPVDIECLQACWRSTLAHIVRPKYALNLSEVHGMEHVMKDVCMLMHRSSETSVHVRSV